MRRLALALTAGAATVLAFAPLGAFWLAPLGVLALYRLLGDAAHRRAAFWLGWAWGLGFFLAGTSWIYVSLSVFGQLPPWLALPATLLFCALMALYPGLAAALFRAAQPAGEIRRALCFAGLMAAAEWLRGTLFTGFPWLALGYSQTPPSPLAGYAPLIGVYGVSCLVWLSGALLQQWRRGALFLLAVLLPGWGLQQITWHEADGPPVRVALVQGNIAQQLKFDPLHFGRTLANYQRLVKAHPAQLTVLPETAVPAFFDDWPADFRAALHTAARHAEGDVLVGTVTGGGRLYWNSVVSLGESPPQIYRKRHLVPFGEFAPPGLSALVAALGIPLSDFSRGAPDQPVFALAGSLRVAPNICYEDAFGRELLAMLPQANLLVNVSNTAWFGDSLAQPQHLQIARLRALESGRPMLRATNTGMTAIILPNGEVFAVLPPFTEGVLVGEVQPTRGLTPYARLGDWPALAMMALFLMAWRWRRRGAFAGRE